MAVSLSRYMSRELSGVLIMAAFGMVVAVEMVTSRMIEDMGWPYWHLQMYACILAALILAVALRLNGTKIPKAEDLKWVLARSVFEDLHWILCVLAVLVGASPGDVAALTSVDIVMAALLGLAFLGEKVSPLHFLALVCSLAGAIFIAQPEFVFGAPEGGQRSYLGYCIALLSGCFQAFSFVCARKSTHISVGVLALASIVVVVPMCGAMPLLPVVHRGSWEPVLAEPWKALGIFLVISLSGWLSLMLPAAGATRCPAAVSATVYTSSSMLFGYAAQTLIFGNAPTLLTMLGAGFMMLSVLMMVVPHGRPEPAEKGEPEPGHCGSPTSSASTEAAPAGAGAETESLGSFVASEISYLGLSGTRRLRSARRRLVVASGCGQAGQAGEPGSLAQRIGAALPVAALAV